MALCLLPGVAAATPSDLLPEEIRALEASGQLDAARKRLMELAPTLDKTDVAQHGALLDRTRNLLIAAEALAQNGLGAQASEALGPILGELLTPRDAPLAVAIQRKRTDLQARLSASQRDPVAERQARDALTRADTLFARRLYDEAVTAYGAVAKQAGISPESRRRGERGVAKASQAQFDARPFGVVATTIRSLDTAGRTVAAWLLMLLAVLPLALSAWLFRRRWLKDERTLELTDNTAPAPTAAGNRQLARHLEEVLERIRLAGRGTATLESTGSGDSGAADNADLPPPDLVFVSASIEVPEMVSEFEKFVSATPAVQVGVVAFNPQQLWAFMRRLFTRRARHAFTGDLTAYDGALILTLTNVDRRTGERLVWRASSPGSDSLARYTCLVDVAARILLATPGAAAVTADCASLKAYALGLYHLGQPETAETLKAAAAHFQAALDHDDNNWPARFQLALVQRKRKDTRAALRHLRWFGEPAARQNEFLQDHVRRHPDFPHAINYHLASTLAVRGDRDDDAVIEGTLQELIGLENDPAGAALERGSLLRLLMLARSAHSTREALTVAALRGGDPRRQEKLTDARSRVTAHKAWFDAHGPGLERAGSAGHAMTRGLVLHACGRIQYANGDQDGAIRALEEAVDLLPDYADVHVDLAKAHLERKKDQHWPVRVASLLDRALALDDRHVKARFVYARFYLTDATRDHRKAEEYLASAPFDPVALFMRAQILHEAGRHAETLDVLERAIALRPQGPTFRVRLYAESLQALVKADPTAPGLAPAQKRLCRYDSFIPESEKDDKNYLRIATVYQEIASALKAPPAECFALPRPTPPPAMRAPR